MIPPVKGVTVFSLGGTRELRIAPHRSHYGEPCVAMAVWDTGKPMSELRIAVRDIPAFKKALRSFVPARPKASRGATGDDDKEPATGED